MSWCSKTKARYENIILTPGNNKLLQQQQKKHKGTALKTSKVPSLLPDGKKAAVGNGTKPADAETLLTKLCDKTNLRVCKPHYEITITSLKVIYVPLYNIK